MSDLHGFDLSAGDRAPVCMGLTAKGTLYASEAQSGRAVVMILARTLESPGLPALLTAFSEQADALAAHEVDLVALIGEDVTSIFEFALANPGRVTLVGSLNDFLQRAGYHGAAPQVLVLDRNQRVAARFAAADAASMVASTMTTVTALPDEAAGDVWMPAPVLILPNLLDPELCQELIALHDSGPCSDSPSLALDQRGRPVSGINHSLKKRSDFLLERDHPMSIRIGDIMQRRCIPEIKRAFQAHVSHTDRYNIACYPGDGGHFQRHRDNRPELISFRKFALSINLTSSAGGYKGGFLRLPEFNSHHYRLATGSGVIFSVALLHEITPVLSGNRYVLITHFHDEEGEVRWLEMRRTLAAMPHGAAKSAA
ncbi:2OG-Fe(II) oxygenase [Bradyrhizobium sp.]|uniref:2OG-Fe(II) oxygenase n=1 Tax=Bradyrhizobium sp. TaxID=376 RepID=UPI003C30ED9D